MDDRTLLELAARAYGFGAQNKPDNRFCWTESEYPRGSGKEGALWNYVGWGSEAELFNSLTSDADAFRLAVALNLFNHPLFAHFLALERFANQDQDDCTAHRRAFTRAAAAAITQEMTDAQE